MEDAWKTLLAISDHSSSGKSMMSYKVIKSRTGTGPTTLVFDMEASYPWRFDTMTRAEKRKADSKRWLKRFV